jgi:hypothetical protein
MIKSRFLLPLCFLLVACGTPAVSDTADHAFITEMPNDSVFNAKYITKIHEISPIPRYHFQIAVPADWKVLDFILQNEPQPGGFGEMAVFRKPGPWETDDTIPADAEITVTAINMEGDARDASAWLHDTIEKNVPEFEILQERTAEGAADILLRYKDANGSVMNRMMAFAEGDRIYLISGSDTANGYRDYAEVFFVAVATFALKNSPGSNPFAQ